MQDKKTLLIQKWIEALEKEGDRQCYEAYFEDGNVCAMGLLMETGSSLGFFRLVLNGDEDWSYADYMELQEFLEIDDNKIIDDNDSRRLPFKEIAAKLRAGEYDIKEKVNA